MKKLITVLFLALGTVLISGCSLTNSAMTEQITALQEQMSGFSSEMETLKQENEQLKQENNDLKKTVNLESGASITDLQNEELKKENEELKKKVEKYKQALLQEKINNKNTITESSTENNKLDNIQKNGNKTFHDNISSLSFEYPNQRKITDGDYVPSGNECDPVVIKKLYNPEEPLRCFEAGCTPEIIPSISFVVRNTSCQYMYNTCNSLDSGLKDACNKLVALGAPEATAASTIGIGLDNGKNYYVLNGNNGKIVIGDFIDGIVQHKNGFFVKNGHIVSISDSEGIYKNNFDDIVKTIDF